MAFERVEVLVLQCNQGMGNLIKVYADGRLANLALIDFGTADVESLLVKLYVKAAIPAVISALKEMSSPRLDLLVVSHQDEDHWSLLADLSTEIQKTLPTFVLGKAIRGGQQWSDVSLTSVEDFTSAFGVNLKTFGPHNSDYANPLRQKYLALLGAVRLRTLIVDVAVAASGKRTVAGGIRNASSAVIVLEAAGNKCIFPGDATVDTIEPINNIINSYFVNPLVPCVMLSVPHHGALRTLASNYRAAKKIQNLTVAEEFARSVQPKALAASAGYYSKYKHPSNLTLNTLAVGVGTAFRKHDYVQWNWGDGEWDEVNDTKTGICTTVLALTLPATFETWKFTILASGAVEVEAITLSAGAPPPKRLIALPAQQRPGAPVGG